MNSNVGSFTNANITVNAKGLITAASNGSGAAGVTVVLKSSTYSVPANNYTVVMSGASWTVTLPDATVYTTGLITLLHNGTSLTDVYTIATTSSQMIGGIAGGSYALYTAQESLVLYSDGTNWQIQDHHTDTGQISLGNSLSLSSTSAYTFTIPSSTVDIGAVYSAPNGNLYTASVTATSTSLATSGTGSPNAAPNTLTKVSGIGPTTLAYSAVSSSVPVVGTGELIQTWTRRGSNAVISVYLSSTSGTNGSGDYIFYLPTGMTANTAIITPFQTVNTLAFINSTGVTSIIPNQGITLVQTATILLSICSSASLYSSTAYRLQALFYDSATALGVSYTLGTNGLEFGNAQVWQWTIVVPILGWQP